MTIWDSTDAAGKLVGALGDVLGREVVDHEDVGLGAGGTERARVSYSQLLPGNTGITTRGRAILAPLYTWIHPWQRKLDGLEFLWQSTSSPALR